MTSNRPTLSDVARHAGVNKATVSVVLNGSRSGTTVSESTRLRIVRAGQELGYQANAIARSLSRRSTNIIGFYVGHNTPVDDPYFVQISRGLQTGCERHRKDLLIHGNLRSRSLDDIYSELLNGKIDGLVLFMPADNPLGDRLAASHLPVVVITDAIGALPSVVVDDAAGGRLTAEHLAEKGHRHVLYRSPEYAFESVRRRHAAFCKTAAEFGIRVTESHGIDFTGRLSDYERDLISLANRQRPTAAVCWNDYFAYALLTYCQEQEILVPDDLAVVGFDGLQPLFARRTWNLTTVISPWADLAATAVCLLASALRGEEISSETVLPVKFHAGSTT